MNDECKPGTPHWLEHCEACKREAASDLLEQRVIATAEHFKRFNKKLSAMSDEQAVVLLDKVFNEHECTPMDEAFMKRVADLVEGVEL